MALFSWFKKAKDEQESVVSEPPQRTSLVAAEKVDLTYPELDSHIASFTILAKSHGGVSPDFNISSRIEVYRKRLVKFKNRLNFAQIHEEDYSEFLALNYALVKALGNEYYLVIVSHEELLKTNRPFIEQTLETFSLVEDLLFESIKKVNEEIEADVDVTMGLIRSSREKLKNEDILGLD